MDPDNLIIKLILTGWGGWGRGVIFQHYDNWKKNKNKTTQKWQKKTLNLLQPGIPHFRWTWFHSVITYTSLSAVSHDTHGKRSPERSRLLTSPMPRLCPIRYQLVSSLWLSQNLDDGVFNHSLVSLRTSLVCMYSQDWFEHALHPLSSPQHWSETCRCKTQQSSRLNTASLHFHARHFSTCSERLGLIWPSLTFFYPSQFYDHYYILSDDDDDVSVIYRNSFGSFDVNAPIWRSSRSSGGANWMNDFPVCSQSRPVHWPLRLFQTWLYRTRLSGVNLVPANVRSSDQMKAMLRVGSGTMGFFVSLEI